MQIFSHSLCGICHMCQTLQLSVLCLQENRCTEKQALFTYRSRVKHTQKTLWFKVADKVGHAAESKDTVSLDSSCYSLHGVEINAFYNITISHSMLPYHFASMKSHSILVFLPHLVGLQTEDQPCSSEHKEGSSHQVTQFSICFHVCYSQQHRSLVTAVVPNLLSL